jgi:glyoxylase-like metal-dependent hydrolase (beta-lactamase superfamily II)
MNRRRFLISSAALPVAGMIPQARGSTTDTPHIGIFTSSPRAFSTNSYWLTGSNGLVFIDTQFLPSDASRMREAAMKETGKPVAAAIVLHPNPDKFNGTATLQSKGVKVFSSSQVIAHIPAVHDIRRGWFYDDFKPDYPAQAPVLESLGTTSRTFTEAGLTVDVHVLGAGCSAAHVVVQAGDIIFPGDLIPSGTHAWLELGMIDQWLARLTELRAMKPVKIYPGRGPAGGVELITQAETYLKFVRDTVLAAKPSGELSRFRQWRLAAAIESRYPELGYPIFMRDGLPAIWKRLQS